MYTKTKLRRAQNIDKFEKIYEKICTIYVNELEQTINKKKYEEKKLKKKRFLAWLFSLLVIISILIIAHFWFSEDARMYTLSYGSALLFFFPFMLIPTVKKTTENSFKNIIKERLIGTLIKEINPNLSYFPFVKDTTKILEQYKLKGFEGAYEECVDDEIIGIIYDNIDVRISNVHIINYTSKSRYTKFEGIFAEFKLNKNINADIRILLPTTNYIENPGNCKKILMDTSSFEKEFNVYTDNKIIANQILTSAVLEQLASYYKKFGMTFELTLQNNEAALRIETGPMFESLTKENLFVYYSILNFTFDLIKDIYSIIENTDI